MLFRTIAEERSAFAQFPSLTLSYHDSVSQWNVFCSVSPDSCFSINWHPPFSDFSWQHLHNPIIYLSSPRHVCQPSPSPTTAFTPTSTPLSFLSSLCLSTLSSSNNRSSISQQPPAEESLLMEPTTNKVTNMTRILVVVVLRRHNQTNTESTPPLLLFSNHNWLAGCSAELKCLNELLHLLLILSLGWLFLMTNQDYFTAESCFIYKLYFSLLVKKKNPPHLTWKQAIWRKDWIQDKGQSCEWISQLCLYNVVSWHLKAAVLTVLPKTNPQNSTLFKWKHPQMLHDKPLTTVQFHFIIYSCRCIHVDKADETLWPLHLRIQCSEDNSVSARTPCLTGRCVLITNLMFNSRRCCSNRNPSNFSFSSSAVNNSIIRFVNDQSIFLTHFMAS